MQTGDVLRQSSVGLFTRGGNSAVDEILQCAGSLAVHFLAVRHGNGGEILQFVLLGLIFGTVPLGHDLVDLHEGFVLGFWDNEKDVDGGGQADGAKNEETVGTEALLEKEQQRDGTFVRED